mmetsp:Transcript_17014/g.37054  ORF Transcript_17014/g.37054 Transcript_17014/m.37054 type:complete len:120 (+) Transcript_17014:1749-2108(+)
MLKNKRGLCTRNGSLRYFCLSSSCWDCTFLYTAVNPSISRAGCEFSTYDMSNAAKTNKLIHRSDTGLEFIHRIFVIALYQPLRGTRLALRLDGVEHVVVGSHVQEAQMSNGILSGFQRG